MNTILSRYRIGFDIGGTFTDFILLDSLTSTIRLHKCLTTPHDPSRGALAGLIELVRDAGLSLGDISDIVHGTHARDECPDRAQRRETWSADHIRISRHSRNGHGAALRHL